MLRSNDPKAYLKEHAESAWIDLSRYGLKTLPDELQEFTDIENLKLDWNHLTAIPPWIGKLTELRVLDINANMLTELPPTIGRLVNLRSLHVQANFLRSLPDEVGTLAALQELILAGNDLKSLPESIGKLIALDRLHLDRNCLQVLPESIGSLSQLTILTAQYNFISTLPDEMRLLKKLRELRLHSNRITEIPSWLGWLPNLSVLELANNELSGEFPDWTELSMSIFDVSKNRLTRLPKSSSSYECRIFDVWGNQLEEPPQKIAEAGLSAIKHYFALKDRPAEEWVWRSSLASLHLQRRSILSVTETLLCSLAFLILLATGHTWPLFGIAAAPMLLLRTAASTAAGVRRLSWLINRLRLRSGALEDRSLLVGPALVAIGFGSVIIKVLTTLQYGWRWTSIGAISDNYAYQLTLVDAFTPPELVPGTESAFIHNRFSVLTFSELFSNFTARPDLLTLAPAYRRSLPITFFGITFAGGFFIAAWFYRFTLKATCLVYWPFLLLYRYDSEDRIDELAKSQKQPADWMKKGPVIAFMAAVAAVSAGVLLRRAGLEDVARIMDNLLPEAFRPLIQRIDPLLPPKVLFTALLFTSLSYFVARFATAGMATVLAAGASSTRSDLRILRGVFKFAATAQNISICVVTAYVLQWAWPTAIGHALDVWHLLF